MKVDSTHPEYDKFKAKWTRCRDAWEGQDAIKARTTRYLPKLEKQTNKDYDAYLRRALFHGATGRTIQGLGGALFRKDLRQEGIPDKVWEDMVKDVTRTGIGIQQLARQNSKQVLGIGRQGVLIDLPLNGGVPYFTCYEAEQIINWRFEWIDGEPITSMVVLREMSEKDDPEDKFKVVQVERIRVLELVEGRYQVTTFIKEKDDKEFRMEDQFVPVVRKKPLTAIPFVCFGAEDTTLSVSKPPLLDLVDTNISHFMTSADLEHGAHYTALPTAWVAGFPEDKELRIGSMTAWVTSNPQARADYLEYTGQGLSALEKRLEVKEKHMAILGARMLEGQRIGNPESHETVELRQSGETSALVDIAEALSDGLTECARWYLTMLASEPGDIRITVNTDFSSRRLDPQELLALFQTYQGGGMSFDTFMFNLEAGEMLPPGRTAEEEQGLIDSEGPRFQFPFTLDEGAAEAA